MPRSAKPALPPGRVCFTDVSDLRGWCNTCVAQGVICITDLLHIVGSVTEVDMQMLMAAPPLRHFYLEQPPNKLGTFNSGLQEVFQGTSGLQQSFLH